MSQPVQAKRTRTLEERYEMLRKTLAHYLLLQVGTFVAGFGYNAIGPAMSILTDKKAELKIREIREGTQADGNAALDALSTSLAESMGETFQSEYDIETGEGLRTVKLHECGCIEAVTSQAEAYELTKPQARSIFCGTCMSSYKKAAEGLGLGFEGKLIGEQGCRMSFSTKR